MSFDYDLVVIGSTPEGIYAARKAVILQARVALVTQTSERYLNHSSSIYSYCLNEIANHNKFQSPLSVVGTTKTVNQEVSLKDIKNYGNLIKENITAEHSLDDIAILGVDVIDGLGEFCRLPKQAFLVNNRQLRARNFLLATGANYSLKSNNLAAANCFTPDSLWDENIDERIQDIVIVGTSHRALELAQGLARLGKKITLTSPHKRILPESVEASMLFQAQLAADGIELLLNSSLEQIKVIEGKTWLQIGKYARETEAIIFTDECQPNIIGLNLEGVGVKSLPRDIIVNDRLQTTNKSIYACGDLLGGNAASHIAQYEVDIALKNMFSFPWFKRDYRYLPIIMATQPSLARIGLTEVQLQSNKRDIYFIRQHFKSVLSAQITGLTTGWCQFIVRSDGEILGCTILSDRALELINIVAMMMRHKIKLSRNPIGGLLTQEISYVSPSWGEILNGVVMAFHQQKIQRDRYLRNRLETWFEWRR